MDLKQNYAQCWLLYQHTTCQLHLGQGVKMNLETKVSSEQLYYVLCNCLLFCFSTNPCNHLDEL